MARSMADDYQDTYRARIEYQHMAYNPNYDYERYGAPDNPRFIEPKEGAETYTKCFGPYATKGVAKQMLTREARGASIKVVSAKVQKASITWEDVE